MEVTGRQVAVDVFPEGIAEFGQQRECRKLDMGGGSGGVQEGAWAFHTSPQRGSAPEAFWEKPIF